jgi:cytoskeletal protein RodZ
MGSAATEQAALIHAETQSAPVPNTQPQPNIVSPPAPGMGPGDSTTPVSAAALAPSSELFLDVEARKSSNSRGLLYSGIGLFTAALGIMIFISSRSPSPETQPLKIEGENKKAVISPAADPKEDAVRTTKGSDKEVEKPVKKPNRAQTPKQTTKNSKTTNRRSVKDTRKSSGTAQVETDKPKEKPTSQKVQFRFNSSPSGALVTMDNRQLGRTPFTSEFSKEITVVSFTFALKGYKNHEESASLAQNKSLNPSLVKKKKKPRPTGIKKSEPKKDAKEDSDRIDDGDPLNERVDELKDF